MARQERPRRSPVLGSGLMARQAPAVQLGSDLGVATHPGARARRLRVLIESAEDIEVAGGGRLHTTSYLWWSGSVGPSWMHYAHVSRQICALGSAAELFRNSLIRRGSSIRKHRRRYRVLLWIRRLKVRILPPQPTRCCGRTSLEVRYVGRYPDWYAVRRLPAMA